MRHLWVVEEANYTGTRGWWVAEMFRLKRQAQKELRECRRDLRNYQYRLVKYVPEVKK